MCIHLRDTSWCMNSELCQSFLPEMRSKKRKYLPKLATGENLVAFGLTESNAGSDVSGTQNKGCQRWR